MKFPRLAPAALLTAGLLAAPQAGALRGLGSSEPYVPLNSTEELAIAELLKQRDIACEVPNDLESLDKKTRLALADCLKKMSVSNELSRIVVSEAAAEVKYCGAYYGDFNNRVNNQIEHPYNTAIAAWVSYYFGNEKTTSEQLTDICIDEFVETGIAEKAREKVLDVYFPENYLIEEEEPGTGKSFLRQVRPQSK